MELNKYIDHTLLNVSATLEDYNSFYEVAKIYRPYSVCVPFHMAEKSYEVLKETPVQIGTVANFPLGQMEGDILRQHLKMFDTQYVDEVDMVINIQSLKFRQMDSVKHQLQDLDSILPNKITKIILETGALTESEISLAVQMVNNSSANFIKTSTGFFSQGATIDAIKIMKAAKSDHLKIKASGGIKNLTQFKSFIKAGADRIGCSSTQQILNEIQLEKK